MVDKIIETFQNLTNVYGLIGFVSFVIIGTILGFTQKAIIFRDYNDLGISFLSILTPTALAITTFIFQSESDQNIWLMYSSFVSVGILLYILFRTIKDNSNPIFGLFAFVTKLILSILFIFNFILFLAPQGSTRSKRNLVRAVSMIFLALSGGLIGALVRNKRGLFNPSKTLGRRSMGI